MDNYLFRIKHFVMLTNVSIYPKPKLQDAETPPEADEPLAQSSA
jgi:hypothetical protein